MSNTPVAFRDARPILQDCDSRLQAILNNAILPFWFPQVVDTVHGGYQLNHDAQGRFLGPSDKMLVTQARTMWFFAYLRNHGYNKAEYIEAARHGFDYLRDTMWDKEQGGFFWQVDSSGKPTRTMKHLYGQGFALYALSEYALAFSSQPALDLATRLFNLLETKAHDPLYGGYRESFQTDWTVPSDDEPGYLSAPHDYKLMNTHLHLMEPLTVYYEASKSPLARERLLELIQIQSNAVVRKTVGACTDKFTRDWRPVPKPEYDVVSYGHDIENIWLLMLACETARLPNGPFLDLYTTLFDYSLRHGYDKSAGGFYYYGPFNQDATNKAKVWWVQAEALVASLSMYHLTQDKRYLDIFTQTLDWTEHHMVDWEHGDWHANVPDNRARPEGKAHAWKGPYHNGRAVVRCSALIQAMLK
ncbi:MAG: AGE family epimerase/isomerase [bacterium]|jgi:mannobiose 2-epimerase|nr:AGE family epimerase/isomerase [bacterium]